MRIAAPIGADAGGGGERSYDPWPSVFRTRSRRRARPEVQHEERGARRRASPRCLRACVRCVHLHRCDRRRNAGIRAPGRGPQSGHDTFGRVGFCGQRGSMMQWHAALQRTGDAGQIQPAVCRSAACGGVDTALPAAGVARAARTPSGRLCTVSASALTAALASVSSQMPSVDASCSARWAGARMLADGPTRLGAICSACARPRTSPSPPSLAVVHRLRGRFDEFKGSGLVPRDSRAARFVPVRSNQD